MSNGQRTGGYDDPPPDDYEHALPDAAPEMSREREAAIEEEREEAALKKWRESPEGRLPHNFEAEAALLGSLMIDNKFVDTAAPIVSVDDFYDPMHGRIYAKILELSYAEKQANPVTLRPYFQDDEDMKQLGGPAYLAQLTGSGAAIIGARDFAEQVRDLSHLRTIHWACLDAAQAALDTSEDISPAALLSDVEEKIAAISMTAVDLPSASLEEAWGEFEAEVAQMEAGAEPAGISIGGRFTDWNAVAGRMEEGDYILLGGRPSMGKTAVGLAVALGAAAAGHPTEFYSLEMDRRKVTRRAFAHLIYEPGVTSTYTQIVAGKLTMDDHRANAAAKAEIKSWPLYINDPAEMFVEELAPSIRRRQRQLKRLGKPALKLVVVDYLSRMRTKKQFKSETEEVSHISRVLKHTAKVCKVTLLVLVQLSRAVESRDNKRPMLADLKQSGSLEQDADGVIFVYRDEYYLERAEPPKSKAQKWEAWSEEMAAVRDQMEIYSSKRREGALVKRISHFFTAHQAVRNSNFFTFRAQGSPIGPQEDVADMFDLPEERG